MDTPVIAGDLTKIYTEGKVEVRAVSSVALELREGEMVGLFGPSGSGKTTLLSLIGCILRPTSGTLKLYGIETNSLGEAALPGIRKKFISFIFQGFNLFPALTALENVMLVLKLKGVEENAEGKAEEMLAGVGLADRMHFLPRDLSGGEKQRVAIARSLAADSPIILADEPTGNLDQGNGRKVMELLKQLATERKKCIFAATHDNRVEGIFDRILYMEDGMIIREKGGHA